MRWLTFPFALCVLSLGMNEVQASLSHTHSKILPSDPSPSVATIRLPRASEASTLTFHSNIHPHSFHQHHQRFGQLPLFFNVEESVAIEHFHPFFMEEEEAVLLAPQLLPTPAPPLPHSLIIEERCGTFVTIDWPESGILYENGEPEPCP